MDSSEYAQKLEDNLLDILAGVDKLISESKASLSGVTAVLSGVEESSFEVDGSCSFSNSSCLSTDSISSDGLSPASDTPSLISAEEKTSLSSVVGTANIFCFNIQYLRFNNVEDTNSNI